MMTSKINPEPRSSVTRRNFLRGLGACLALPALESFHPLRLMAAEPAGAAGSLATTASGAPLRAAFVYFPNGAIPSAWWPAGEGSDFTFNQTLQPLEKLKPHLQVLGGLDHVNAAGGKDGAGDHARANGTFLTGVRLKKSATQIRAGTSIDQVMARQVGASTRFPSLELTCDYSRKSGACDAGYSCAYQYNISWSSATTPMSPESNPRLVFERLFGAGSPAERADNLARRRQQQQSILDFVLDDARAMQKRLGQGDKEKLDQYLTGVREIETRIERAEHFGKVKDPGVDAPAGVPATHEEYVQLMYDLMLMTFQSDSTRVITMLLAHDGSNRSFAEIGVPEGHHDLSHHFNKEEKIRKVATIDQWYVAQFAKFLAKMQETKDADGSSLLHNSMIVYGGGNADGNRHTHTNLPILLAGAGGGALTPGRYAKFGSKPASNLFLTLSDIMGLQGLERFGDSTGRLAGV